MAWTPSNEPGRYNRARVAQLNPVQEAIENMGLPLSRFRLLNGILNALTMQIECGGDSPEVNRSLIDALRAAVLHQVGEEQARTALRAIDAFRQAEGERWEQIKAGTLPPMQLTLEEQLDDLVHEGYDLLKAGHLTSACDRWLEAWRLVKRLVEPAMRTADAFDEACDLYPLISNWCQDFEMELGNAALDDPVYHEHRLRYTREFLAQFSEESALTVLNFTRAQGETLWAMGQQAEAEAVYAALIERYPDDAWGYIGWADNYYLYRHSPKEYAQAEAILRRALARPHLQERNHVLERLADLYGEWGKPEEQAEIVAQLERLRAQPESPRRAKSGLTQQPQMFPPASKPRRNDPCWCGSGKKYKHCHLVKDSKKRTKA